MKNCPEWSGDGKREASKGRYYILVKQINHSATTRLISSDQVRQWHRHLFESDVPLAYYAGNYRQNNAEMPCLAQRVYVRGIPGAHFLNALPRAEKLFSDIESAISKLELNWDSLTMTQRVVEFCAILTGSVGEFVRIHPFINGNGRTSRAIWMWMLARYRLPPMFGVLRRPKPPYSELMARCMKGDFLPLVQFVKSKMIEDGTPPKLK